MRHMSLSYGKICINFRNIIFVESTKELSLCHELWFSNPYIYGFQRRRPLTFQTMTSFRSNSISLKYQRFTTLGSKNIGIRKSEFVAKTQFLCKVPINKLTVRNLADRGGGNQLGTKRINPFNGFAYFRKILISRSVTGHSQINMNTTVKFGENNKN